MLKLQKVSKFYYSKGIVSSGFSKVSLDLNIGEFVAITGESGSGKSTLLNVISGLDSYEEGEMYVNGEETSHFTEKDYEVYRKKYIGNIFQNFNLINSYTVYQNVELVLLINGYKKKDIKQKVLDIIKEVGLNKYKNTKVSKLSGGQKQRVAIARCLAKDTPIIIADEPTGNLDSKSASSVIKLLSDISKNKLVIVVTHNYDQVEEYVTRKITMHDGRIIEDVRLKNTLKVDNVLEASYKETSILNKIRLGFRNTFNIVPKFLLMLMVYLFVIFSISSVYSAFVQGEDEARKDGYNNFFSTLNADKRIILKKDGEKAFTDEDYEKIEKVSGVDYIIKNDVLYDNSVSLYNDNIYLYGQPLDISAFRGKIDEGRMPESDDEVVLLINKNDWTLTYYKDEILSSSLNLNDMKDYSTGKNYTAKVVGISYLDSGYNTAIYFTNSTLNKLNSHISYMNNKTTYSYAGRTYDSYPNDTLSSLVPNTNVPKGEAYISSNRESDCKNYNCNTYGLIIKSSNRYYTKDMTLTIGKSYTKNDISSRFGVNYEDYDGSVFINPDDYESLFEGENYQLSVFVKNDKEARDIEKELNKMGYDAFYLLDGIQTNGALQIVRIFKVIILSILIIVLFFISYFVIKLILKSRNVYFSTIRMLGSTSKTAKNLLDIELNTITNIVYLIFISVVLLIKFDVIEVEYLQELVTYLGIKEYIIIYLILFLMSYLTSTRYARKLFKKSAISTYREEV